MRVTRPLPESPLVVSYGAGLDSTGLLVLLHHSGIRPDLIVFSDTGAEKPETYAALTAVSAWCELVGFPAVTRVRYEPERARYENLEGNCLQNDTLPSLAFGGHSCSLKWKVDAIDAYLRTWEPALRAVEAGRKIVRAIGYDASGADTRRFAKADKLDKAREERGEWTPWSYWYPLREVGLTRGGLERLVAGEPMLAEFLRAAVGQPFPVKSSCFFCPAARKVEIEELARAHPDLALRGVVMEYRARTGKHGLGSTKGLGRNWSWEEHLTEVGLLPADWKAQAMAAGLLPADWDAYSARVTAEREAAGEDKAAQKAAKEGVLAPDWADRPQSEVTTADRRAKRAASKRWREAVKRRVAWRARRLPLAA